jgi:putative addiction module CopG family antidote
MIKTNFPMKHSQQLLFIALTLAVNASTAWAKDLLYRNDFSGPTAPNPINWVTSQIVNE